MTDKTIASLRDELFAQLTELKDPTKIIDIERARLRLGVANAIIATARIEVEFAAVMKGSMEVPFIEAQTMERSAEKPKKTNEEKVLDGGPSPNHPWRSTVHRMDG